MITSSGNEKIKLRQFGTQMGALVGIMFGFIFPILTASEFPIWPWPLSLLLFCLGLFRPQTLRWMNEGWIRLGEFLGKVTTPILLAAIFFFLVWPIGFLKRKLGKQVIPVDYDPSIESYREQPAVSQDMRDPF